MAKETNLAYDFALFERKEERPIITEAPVSPAMQKQRKRQRALQSVMLLTAVVCIVAILGGGTLWMVAGTVRVNELKASLADRQQVLAEMQSERVRLEAELAAKTSAAEVDAYIIANGMVQIETHQITYIVHSQIDEVTVTTPEAVPWYEQLWTGLCALFSS
jgi:cytoskeletal protein RodZ